MLTYAARNLTLRVLAGLLLLTAFAAPAAAEAAPQDRDRLNRLVQTGANSDAASRAFAEGRTLLDEQKWSQAVVTFSKFLTDYPTDRNADAAMYWLAYASEKQGRNKQAEEVLANLLRAHPRSTWADDAKVLRVKVRTKLGLAPEPPQVDDKSQLQIIALQALCQNDRASCAARAAEVLSSNAAPVVKEAALTLLGQYGGPEAVPALIQFSRNDSNDKLRMRAIRALGKTGDERGLDVLRELAMSQTYADESPADSAIHALAEHESPRATQLIAEVVLSGRNQAARVHAVQLMSRRRGEQVVDSLLRIYDSVPDVQMRKHVLAGLGVRADPRAVTKLAEVARTSDNVELRKQAIYTISHRKQEPQTLDLILPLYDSERDPELKRSILDGIGQFQTQRAYQKLMQVVRDTNEPLERRKRAISMLSKSKDPEVMRFLEGMLK